LPLVVLPYTSLKILLQCSLSRVPLLRTRFYLSLCGAPFHPAAEEPGKHALNDKQTNDDLDLYLGPSLAPLLEWST
jgi:hypothetical protein